ncbi:MAG: SRPBCC domain-containing protein [Polyangia bacterium]
MRNQSLKLSFTVAQSPKEVFKAINNVRGWWADGLVGTSDRVGASFTYQHKDLHLSTQKVTEMVPDKKVVWHVSYSQFPFFKNRSEWDDTEIVFEIEKRGDKTEVTFTHVGLVPALECFEDCKSGWSNFFGDSLRKLIATGKGGPDSKEHADSRKYPISRQARSAQAGD